MTPAKFAAAAGALAAAGYGGARHLAAVNGRAAVSLSDRSVLSVDAAYQLSRGRVGHAQLPSLGAVGCTLSHLAAWRAAAASGAAYTMVCEDDVAVHTHGGADALRSLLRRLDAAGEAWDVLLLGGMRRVTRPSTVAGVGVVTDRFLGAEAYLVTPHGAAVLAAHALPMTMQVDAYMGTLAHLGELRMLAPTPHGFMYQDTCAATSIQETATLQGKVTELGRAAFCHLCRATGNNGMVGVRSAALPLLGGMVLVVLALAVAARLTRAPSPLPQPSLAQPRSARKRGT